MLQMVRMNVRADVTPMRHDGTMVRDAPGVSHRDLAQLGLTDAA
jgi:hypothetical protein